MAPKHDMYVNASSRGWFPLYGETYMVIASESKGKGQPISVNDIALPKYIQQKDEADIYPEIEQLTFANLSKIKYIKCL